MNPCSLQKSRNCFALDGFDNGSFAAFGWSLANLLAAFDPGTAVAFFTAVGVECVSTLDFFSRFNLALFELALRLILD